jgi:hypothetical protein
MRLYRLTERMARLSQTLEKNSVRKMKTIALAVQEELVINTPIDVGTAESNWIGSIGAPYSGTVKALIPGSKGSTYVPTVGKSIAKFKAVVQKARTGDKIYLVNNVPYIGALNNGRSLQSPANFIQTAIERGKVAASRINMLRDLK